MGRYRDWMFRINPVVASGTAEPRAIHPPRSKANDADRDARRFGSDCPLR